MVDAPWKQTNQPTNNAWHEQKHWLVYSSIGTAQACYELFRINPGSDIPENNSCGATFLPSQKPSK